MRGRGYVEEAATTVRSVSRRDARAKKAVCVRYLGGFPCASIPAADAPSMILLSVGAACPGAVWGYTLTRPLVNGQRVGFRRAPFVRRPAPTAAALRSAAHAAPEAYPPACYCKCLYLRFMG